MFVLLFRYVFAGAIHVPGGSYVDYLMPGSSSRPSASAPSRTAIGLAEDLHKGLLERFRALPMARSAVLAGRTTADLVRNVFVDHHHDAVGFLVGLPAAAQRGSTTSSACVVMMLFAFALMWGFAFIGLAAPNAETAQVMSFPILFPLTSLVGLRPGRDHAGLAPGLRRPPAGHPVVNAARSLMVGGVLLEQYAVWQVARLERRALVVLAPLAVRKYRTLV